MENFFPDFSKQYNNTYKIRLNTIKPLINSPFSIEICEQIHDLNLKTEKCLIKGIFFISSDLKTTIFDKLNKNEKKINFKKSTYISKDVKYFLEDETGRIELILTLNKNEFICTGMVLGFIGFMKNNKFEVDKIVFPDQLIENNIKKDVVNKKLCILSGLEINKTNNNLMSFTVISDYLFMQGITDLFLIGCFFKEDFECLQKCIDSSSLNITLIPEYSDFNSFSFPITPVHKKLFKKKTTSYTNPCITDFNNKTLSITSLEIIKDLLKYLDQEVGDLQLEADGYRLHLNEEKIDETNVHLQKLDSKNITNIVNGLLKCRLLCPNGPDTLTISPYNNKEIFFVDKAIDYFLIPNCNNQIYQKSDIFNCQIISIPNFNDTKKVLILDFLNEDIEFVEFTN